MWIRKRNWRLTCLLLLCGIFGLVALPHASSYTNAFVTNACSLNITENENALIAIRLPRYEVCFPGNTITGCITNNMSVALTSLTATNGAQVDRPSLASGGTAALLLTAGTKGKLPPAPVSTVHHTGHILASWPNGEASISYSTSLEVIDPEQFSYSYDRQTQALAVSNPTKHNLYVSVDGNAQQLLPSLGQISLQCTRAQTQLEFSLGSNNRSHTLSLPTPLPQAVMQPKDNTAPATPEAPPAPDRPDATVKEQPPTPGDPVPPTEPESAQPDVSNKGVGEPAISEPDVPVITEVPPANYANEPAVPTTSDPEPSKPGD